MNAKELKHFLQLQNHLTNIPFSLIRNEICTYSTTLSQSFVEKFFRNYLSESVSYHLSDDFFISGTIKISDSYYLCLGPATISTLSSDESATLIKKLNQKTKAVEQETLASLNYTPFESFLNVLCLLQLVINHQIINGTDLIKKEENSLTSIKDTIKKAELDKIEEEQFQEGITFHSSQIEERIALSISLGNSYSLGEILQDNSYQLGKLAPNAFRHLKNATLILNSIALRSSIKGGLDSATAYRLGGIYSQKIENCGSIDELNTLSWHMTMDYCNRVKNQKKYNHLQLNDLEQSIKKSIDYILDHLADPICLDELASYSGYSVPHFSKKFKSVTGTNFSHFVNELRCQEAKERLILTDYSILEISSQVGYSSQSYFQKIFKKIVQQTPQEYRNKNKLNFI